MKKAIMILVTVISLMSCTPDDICGNVTGWDIDDNADYIVYIEGKKQKVIASTFYDAQVGDYMCIEY